MPMAVPAASMVLVWKVLFHEKGLINSALLTFGRNGVNWMGSDAAFWMLVISYLWKNLGYTMILWTAGLSAIPEGIYEAAQVDGATKWQTFLHITFLAMGIDELSVSPSAVLPVRAAIRQSIAKTCDLKLLEC